jgi:acetyltransferase-like isoleucine patch superfamily enzyme
MKSFIKSILKYIFFKIKYLHHNVIINSSFVSIRSIIGNNVLIQSNTFVSANSIVGDYTYINKNSSVENTIIGKYCSIASGVIIGPYEHDYKKLSTHPFWRESFYGLIKNNIKDENYRLTTIGNDVWIGTNVIIKSGATIGDGAIIGAGSVVTKKIPPYEIWAGVPAKKIKDRFDNQTKNKLLKLDWTNKNNIWIQKNILPNINLNIDSLLDKINP